MAFERLLAYRTTRVIACCHAVGEFYRRQVGLEPRRLEVIYNAVNFSVVAPRIDRQAARAELGYGPGDLVLLYTVVLFTMNFLVDLSYAILDPRVELK